MRTCNVFDKYRDGELNSAERNEFEKHLAVCENCQTKTALLNNIVHVLKQGRLCLAMLADSQMLFKLIPLGRIQFSVTILVEYVTGSHQFYFRSFLCLPER